MHTMVYMPCCGDVYNVATDKPVMNTKKNIWRSKCDSKGRTEDIVKPPPQSPS